MVNHCWCKVFMEPSDPSQTSCKAAAFPDASDVLTYSSCSFITLILDTVGRKKPLMFGAGSFVITYSVLTAIVACPSSWTNFKVAHAKSQ